MGKVKQKVSVFGRVLFVLYIIAAVYFLFLSDGFDRTMTGRGYRCNLSLFTEIRRFWLYRDSLGLKTFIINIVGNIVCFMPFGFLLPTVSRKNIFRNGPGVFACTLLFTICVETLQLVLKVGVFDVDDIFLNTCGGMLGYFVLKFVWQKYKNKKTRRAARSET